MAAAEPQERVAGHLEVGTNGKGEVVINHPRIETDAAGVGHIVFSPRQARGLAGSLLAQADRAALEAGPPAARVKVRFIGAQSNPMFPDELTALLRFARPSAPIICVACGRPRKKLWTMLCAFRCGVAPAGSFHMQVGAERPALSLVCDDHPINPADAVLEAMRGEREIDAPVFDGSAEIQPGDFSMDDTDDDDEDQ